MRSTCGLFYDNDQLTVHYLIHLKKVLSLVYIKALLCSVAADIISTVEFNSTGELLATGDKGGRVVVFQREQEVIYEKTYEICHIPSFL